MMGVLCLVSIKPLGAQVHSSKRTASPKDPEGLAILTLDGSWETSLILRLGPDVPPPAASPHLPAQ